MKSSRLRVMLGFKTVPNSCRTSEKHGCYKYSCLICVRHSFGFQCKYKKNGGYVWGYWISSLMYGMNGLAVTKMLGEEFSRNPREMETKKNVDPKATVQMFQMLETTTGYSHHLPSNKQSDGYRLDLQDKQSATKEEHRMRELINYYVKVSMDRAPYLRKVDLKV